MCGIHLMINDDATCIPKLDEINKLQQKRAIPLGAYKRVTGRIN